MQFSVIIPYFKGESFIFNCVQSIFTSFENISSTGIIALQLIIIVDCDTSTEKVAEQLPVPLVPVDLLISKNETNKGVASSRNRGLSQASGEYVYLIDQDDEVRVDFFQKILPSVLSKTDFILCNGKLCFQEKGYEIKLYYFMPKLDLKNIALRDIIRSPGQVVVKKSVINKFRFPVPSEHFGCDDKFCWILIFALTPPASSTYIDDCIYKAAIHNRNYSSAYKELYYCGLELWDQVLQLPVDAMTLEIARRNKLFYKHQLSLNRTKYEVFWGAVESLRYHTYSNKLIGFFLKKLKHLNLL